MEKKNKEMTKAQPKRGLWKPEEDLILKNYIETHGEGNWATVSKRSGLMRGGKSCRLRWKNYLRPNIKRGGMSKEEEDLIIRMHKLLGNRIWDRFIRSCGTGNPIILALKKTHYHLGLPLHVAVWENFEFFNGP
ncbi:hypothetical protein COLO4_35139 [Corchorus olitorius]|uniref:Uncharacterized protein n=1 Tax=Corchorus olitorius TaxID=93759 RepID=A0A1R3GI13_9ROSI|nr:hypothetical protein COLO4_35139 [Corchorus olitorius]